MIKEKFNTLISVDQLAENYDRNDVVILDCRSSLADPDLGRRQYLEAHIPGAYFMDINLDLSSPVIKGITGRHPLPDPLVFTAAMRAAGLHPGTQVVVYDQQNGMYAARAWWLLRWIGHEQVALLDGGFEAWTAMKLPIDNQCYPPKQGTYTFNTPDQITLTTDEVARQTQTLIDSRNHDRFTGKFEPIDPVAGHIPGAICLPFSDNTDEKGFWKSAEFLKKKFESYLDDSTQPPVFYCGSGVTACHNLLAYKIATGRDALLYAGSYSEWINYYPVATGV